MSWIEKYTAYMQQAEAPPNFVFWSGILSIAAIMKRKVFYKRKLQTIYPNVYVILTGPPGSGKGSAIIPTVKILKSTGIPNFLADRMSAEEICAIISNGFGQGVNVSGGGTVSLGNDDKSALVVEEEFGSLFGISDWMLEFLNKMWDSGEYDYQTRSNHSKPFLIRESALCVLAGTIPEHLKFISVHRQTAAISGGFSSRCIMPYANAQQTQDFWGTVGMSKVVEDSLVDELQKIYQNINGEFTFSLEAKKTLADFYYSIDFDSIESDAIRNFRNRLITHVGKTALCLAISDQKGQVIQEKHINKAIEELKKVEKNLDVIFAFVGESQDIEGMARVQQFINKKGVTTRKEILISLKRYVSSDQLNRILTVLEDDGSGHGVFTYVLDPSTKQYLIKSKT